MRIVGFARCLDDKGCGPPGELAVYRAGNCEALIGDASTVYISCLVGQGRLRCERSALGYLSI